MYKYFNPNPKARVDKATGKPKRWHIADCAVRCICGATGMNWQAVYGILCEIGAKNCCMPSDKKAIDIAMKDLGFTKGSYERGTTRETVREFAKNHADQVAVVNLAGHVVCCKDGAYWDTWDCGAYTAYSYWYKPANK